MEQKDIDELLNDANQNILGEYDLTEMCINLTHSELVNVIGWTLNEVGYDKKLYELLKEYYDNLRVEFYSSFSITGKERRNKKLIDKIDKDDIKYLIDVLKR